MNKRIVIFLAFLAVLGLACNLLSSGGKTPPPASQGVPGGGSQPVDTDAPAGTPPAEPVSINDGLGSLNSYQMAVMIHMVGPDLLDSNTVTITVQHSKDLDATYTHYEMVRTAKNPDDAGNSNSDNYSIGNDQCSYDGEEYDWSSSTPAEAEMTDLSKSMISLTPLIDNPTFVAQEEINGIPANHFTFTVSGLGVESGAQVNLNQGDYWLAVDGQYIVKYLLTVETSTDPQTNVYHEEISIDLTQINQPISISFPQGCLDASLKTPNP